MRPHDLAARSRATLRAAAHTIFVDTFSWLRGFPLSQRGKSQLRWMVVPRPGDAVASREIPVTQDLLPTATHGLKQLVLRFPRQLAVVGADEPAWRNGPAFA